MTRILVVEDDHDIAELVRRYLDKSGYAIEVLSSGRDAVMALAERPPDLMVLDVMLPDVSGTEICRIARGRGGRQAFPSSC
jgi:DNA-binding response OmpR family regulator